MSDRPGLVAFRVDGLPPGLNEWTRQHWSVRKRLSKTWGDKVHFYAIHAGVRGAVGGKPFDVPVVARLTFFGPGDPDGRAKFILDGLVPWLLKDDRYPFVHEFQLRSRPGKREILVEVWPA